MIELIFVIVVIGILASIAMPKLWVTRDDAIIAKGRAEVSTIRSGIATERQKSLLSGNAAYPASLDKDNKAFGAIMEYGVATSDSAGHWSHEANTTTYIYHLGDTDVNFTYNPDTGKFDCDHTVQGCKDLTE
ncbi:type II secretion system protein [Hydrogenimonas sp. SS33]|uniref:type II secretion system protein n=1 Tax=Hydrogenimonas leucolamina TaxID=2954236 RepID=UPI00336BD655